MANSWATEFDADVRQDFRDEGLADGSTYTAPGGSPIDCTVMVDYDTTELGDVARVSDRIAQVTLFKDQVAKPVSRAVIAIGSKTFTLDARVDEDDSRSIWTARYDG